MKRLFLSLAFFCVPVAAGAASDVVSAAGPCRTEYVVPYTDQCGYAYHTISKDRSPQNLQTAFVTCDRAQSAAVACVKSPTKQIHSVALGALFTDVSAQAEIAMFAGQYAMAETLLREKLSVIDAIGSDAHGGGDASLARMRASTEDDIADSLAGQCTWKALASAGQQQQLLHAHRYGELATLLQRKSTNYTACSRLAATPAHRAYVEYMGYVALEEGGRAAQAAGEVDTADHIYRACIAGTARTSIYAAKNVKAYLGTVNTLCRGRLSGRYTVDQPEPIDADDGTRFKPLTLPKT
jgi:hypothetical protein